MTRKREDGRPNRSQEASLGSIGHALIAAGYQPKTEKAGGVQPEPPAFVMSPQTQEAPRKPHVEARDLASLRAPTVVMIRTAKAPRIEGNARIAQSSKKATRSKKACVNIPSHMAPVRGAAPEFATGPASPRPAEATAERDISLDARRRRIEARVKGLSAAFAKREISAAQAVRLDNKSSDSVRRRLAAAAAPRRAGDIIEIVLGIDFGTTSTKVVARRSYFSGSPAVAMPAPVLARPEPNPHLWASRLWRTADGRLTLTPERGAGPICAIKTRLLESEAHDAMAHAAAFLGQIIAHARGWLIEERSDFVGPRSPYWRHHFGFPAASLDDDALADRYRKVASAAVRLAEMGRAPTETEAHDAVDAAMPCAATLARAGVLLFPEVAGATAAFATSREFSGNLNAMVDIGGGTVDVCTFNLHSPAEGERIQPIFRAAVDLLGVEPSRLCEGDHGASDDFGRCLDVHLRRVIWETKQHHAALSDCWRQGLPVLVVGGGVLSPRHDLCVRNLDGWLRNRQQACPGGVRIIRAPSPESFQHDAGSHGAHRLSVALGLSLPETEIPEVRQRIPPVLFATPTDIAGRYIGPEQM
jgi:hypothetical protein